MRGTKGLGALVLAGTALLASHSTMGGTGTSTYMLLQETPLVQKIVPMVMAEPPLNDHSHSPGMEFIDSSEYAQIEADTDTTHSFFTTLDSFGNPIPDVNSERLHGLEDRIRLKALRWIHEDNQIVFFTNSDSQAHAVYTIEGEELDKWRSFDRLNWTARMRARRNFANDKEEILIEAQPGLENKELGWMTGRRHQVQDMMEWLGPWYPYLQKIMRECGGDEDFLTQSIQESGGSLTRSSKADCLGPWQLNWSNAASYGWKGQREHPLSLGAACRLMRVDTFKNGNANLALNAYNTGAGNIEVTKAYMAKKYGLDPEFKWHSEVMMGKWREAKRATRSTYGPASADYWADMKGADAGVKYIWELDERLHPGSFDPIEGDVIRIDYKGRGGLSSREVSEFIGDEEFIRIANPHLQSVRSIPQQWIVMVQQGRADEFYGEFEGKLDYVEPVLLRDGEFSDIHEVFPRNDRRELDVMFSELARLHGLGAYTYDVLAGFKEVRQGYLDSCGSDPLCNDLRRASSFLVSHYSNRKLETGSANIVASR